MGGGWSGQWRTIHVVPLLDVPAADELREWAISAYSTEAALYSRAVPILLDPVVGERNHALRKKGGDTSAMTQGMWSGVDRPADQEVRGAPPQ